MLRQNWLARVVMGLTILGWASQGDACPFCSAQSQTFSEEMATMDVVVIAKLVALPPPPKEGAKPGEAEVPKAKFEVVQVLKGKSILGDKKGIETVYFGDGKQATLFLIMAVDPQSPMWSTPLPVSDRARDYLVKLPDLPKEGAARLEFFQNHLEDSDEMLARDAYDEFAKAPYIAVQELKSKMPKEKLVSWIKNPEVPASRRRLYLTMLGVCGGEADVPMLEEMLKSDDRKARSGLDALIACYLTLKGPDGMPLVEELFLKNPKAEYADTYAAIMALRFHGSETNVVPKSRLLVGMRYMLDRPQLADLVIPDLARWEDWSQMDRLVKLFKEADEKSSWVRVPVVNYLRACPLPEAKARIKELEQIDPSAVKRANTFFPFGAPAPAAPASPPKTSEANPPASPVTSPRPVVAQASALVTPATTDPVATSQFPPAVAAVSPGNSAGAASASPVLASPVLASPVASPVVASPVSSGPSTRTLSTRHGAGPVASARALDSTTSSLVHPRGADRESLATVPNRWRLVGVAWLVGAALMLVQWTLFRGTLAI